MRLIIGFLACFMAWICPTEAKPIYWYTQYEEAVSVAEKNHKPLILFFTGSDWCSWCHKLENEVLNTAEFSNEVGDQFVFVKLDFPLYAKIDPKLREQNEQLQKKYQINGYPTMIILDSKQQKIGSSGYKPGGGTAYARYLKSLLQGYSAYQSKMEQLPSQQLTGEVLQALLEQASSLKREKDRHKIIQAGLQSDRKQYFLLEAYQNLVDEGQIHYPAARQIKKQLQNEDPENQSGIHFQIALIDFEAFLEEMEKENYDPEFAIEPLIAYIKKFGDKDATNLWQLEMLISQVYLDKNHIQDALNHAKASLQAAPLSTKSQIDLAIKKIQANLLH